MTKRVLSLLLCLVMSLSMTAGLFTLPAHAADTPQIKNIIYMIPDGGAMAPFYLADSVKHYGGFNKEMFPNATPVTTDGMYIFLMAHIRSPSVKVPRYSPRLFRIGRAA